MLSRECWMATPAPSQKLPQRERGLGLDILCRVNLHPLNRQGVGGKELKSIDTQRT